MQVPFVNPSLQYQKLKTEIIKKFDEISTSGVYVLGNEGTRFEENFARYCNTSFAIGVGNGSDALFLSLLALGISSNDEVITAPNSFVATAWAIANVGAKLVFADVGEDYNIDPDLIERSITPKTKAILPVHWTGKIAKMDEIKQIASDRNLLIIEDAAQSVGATYKKQKSGSFGNAGCFSLHPLKNLHVHGDGGIITTNDEALYQKIMKMRNHGLKSRNECEFWGWNSRLDEIHAGIANIKLSHLDKWNERSLQIASIYIRELKGIVDLPQINENEQPVFHRFIIRSKKRDELKRFLEGKGVGTAINYPIPLHLQEASSNLGYKKGDFPRAENQAKEVLSLPIYPELEDKQINFVISSVKEFFSFS